MARTEEVGECVEWQKYFQNGTPYVQHGDRFVAVRQLVMEFLGNQYEGRTFFGTSCKNKACINPQHIVARSAKEHAKFMANNTDHNSPTRIAKLQKAAERRAVINKDQASQIRLDPRRCEDIAVQFGVSKSLVAKIKRGEAHRPVSAQNNPFWGLMA